MRCGLVLALLSGAGLGAGSDEERVVALEVPAADGAATPALCLDEGGRPLLSWVEPADAGAHALRLARLEQAGFPAPLEVARGAGWVLNWADFPSVAVDPAGRRLAHWLASNGPASLAYEVRVALAADGRAAFGPGRRLHQDTTPAEHGFVSAVGLAGGGFGALWLDGSGVAGHGHGVAGAGATALRFARVDQEGAPRDEQQLDPRVCDCCATALVRMEDESLAAAWRDRSDEERRDIAFARGRVDADGSWRWSAPRAVHADGWTIAGCPVNGPALATQGGRLACAWFTLGDDQRARVQVALLEPGRERFSAPVRVDDGAPEGRVDLVFVGEALWVSWLERRGRKAEWRVRELRYADGALAPAIPIAEVELGRESGFARMVPFEGGLLFAWSDGGVRAARVRLER